MLQRPQKYVILDIIKLLAERSHVLVKRKTFETIEKVYNIVDEIKVDNYKINAQNSIKLYAKQKFGKKGQNVS